MLILVIISLEMLIIMSKIIQELKSARQAAGLSQERLADKAGLHRMSVQKIEAEDMDPKLSTLQVMARALGMDLMLVPATLRPSLEDFVRSGGKFLGQPAGVAAPPSIVDDILNKKTPRTGTK